MRPYTSLENDLWRSRELREWYQADATALAETLTKRRERIATSFEGLGAVRDPFRSDLVGTGTLFVEDAAKRGVLPAIRARTAAATGDATWHSLGRTSDGADSHRARGGGGGGLRSTGPVVGSFAEAEDLESSGYLIPTATVRSASFVPAFRGAPSEEARATPLEMARTMAAMVASSSEGAARRVVHKLAETAPVAASSTSAVHEPPRRGRPPVYNPAAAGVHWLDRESDLRAAATWTTEKVACGALPAGAVVPPWKERRAEDEGRHAPPTKATLKAMERAAFDEARRGLEERQRVRTSAADRMRSQVTIG